MPSSEAPVDNGSTLIGIHTMAEREKQMWDCKRARLMSKWDTQLVGYTGSLSPYSDGVTDQPISVASLMQHYNFNLSQIIEWKHE